MDPVVASAGAKVCGTGAAGRWILALGCWCAAAGGMIVADEKIPWTEAWLKQTSAADFQREFPVEWDWLRQDCGAAATPASMNRGVVRRVVDELNSSDGRLRAEVAAENAGDGSVRWLQLYARACEARRAQRLATVMAKAPQIAFVKRRTIRPSFFAYTEGQSDAQAERHFLPGSALCLMSFEGTRAKVGELLADKGGVIRDPALSWDGGKLAFGWKKSLDADDYHLYELDLTSKAVRQVTRGAGVADYEPAYLPNGDFIFASTRCVQTVDCWWTEVSNLYTCDSGGKAIRRLGFDQVHTVYPQVLDDGRVIYTRWDYNDRGQVFPQPLFQMNPDGTSQTEYYGNNSWFPTTIAHARGIPGTAKVLAILCGHHSSQAGKLAVIDPALGRQENQGVRLVSPERATPAERIDSYGQQGELFAYPFPLNEREWLVSYVPDGWKDATRNGGDCAFGIFWMDRDGRRELLTTDVALPCLQAVPVTARPRPPVRQGTVDFSKDYGTYYVRDVYQGPGLAGIPRGTIRKMRVVALDFRPAGIRSNGSGGPGGGALVSTPVAVGNGAWDVKRVLGETPVREDGSAYFIVPARTPVYFQAIDERGRAVQTMRSWSTLQPGEISACMGCHEEKNSAPPVSTGSLALSQPPLRLEPFYGPARGFGFVREIQPILDRQCVRCHQQREPVMAMAAGERPTPLEQAPALRSPERERAFGLSGGKVRDEKAGREWSDAYLTLTQASRDGKKGGNGPFRGQPEGPWVRWISSQSVPSPLPPAFSGSSTSRLLKMLDEGHHDVRLSREEYEKLACWIDLLVPYCGDYTEANIWTAGEMEKFRRYETKRHQLEASELETLKTLGKH